MKKLFKNMDENQKNKLIIIICIITIFVFITISIGLSIKNQKESLKEEYEYKEVVDNNRYFTVMSCVSKYINYLSTENTENLLTVLDKQYVSDNGITFENIYQFINKVDSEFSYTYDGDIMYERRISNNALEYKVTGYLTKDNVDGTIDKTNYPLVVTLFENELVFAIRPGE